MSDSDRQQTARPRTSSGMRDILPGEAAVGRRVKGAFWEVARSHGFVEIRTPCLEPEDLLARSLGAAAETARNRTYTVQTSSGERLALRSEGTVGVARAYAEHDLQSLPQPVKLAHCSTVYHDEPAREYEQCGLEAFGTSDPALDAQVILACWQVLSKLGLSGLGVQVNSLGGPASQKKIKRLIVDTVTPHAERLSDEAQLQLKENPLRILGTQDPATREVVEQIPPLVDQLATEDRDHLTMVLEHLEQAGIPYELNPHLARGFDYHTRTVFEICDTAKADVQLAGGGRYDDLVHRLGGPATPAMGAACDVHRIVGALQAKSGAALSASGPEVYLIQLGDVAKQHAFGLLKELTEGGISVTAAFDKEGIRGQLRKADKLGVSLALIIGQKEAMENSIIVRDMSSGMQETVPLKEAVREVGNRLPRNVDPAG